LHFVPISIPVLNREKVTYSIINSLIYFINQKLSTEVVHIIINTIKKYILILLLIVFLTKNEIPRKLLTYYLNKNNIAGLKSGTDYEKNISTQ